MYTEYTYNHEKVTLARRVKASGGHTECKSYSHPQGVCKKKTCYTRLFYLVKVSLTPPSPSLPKKEINHVFMCQAQLSRVYGDICATDILHSGHQQVVLRQQARGVPDLEMPYRDG